MKVERRIEKIIVWVLICVISAALLTEFATQVLFKDRIEQETRLVLKDRLESTANFEDLSITIFRNFPNLTITFKSISIIEGPYEILDAGELKLHFNPLEFISKDYIFKKVEISQTTLKIVIDSTGHKYEIRGKPTPDEPARKLSLDIPEIIVTDSRLLVDNAYKKAFNNFYFDHADLRLISEADMLMIQGDVDGRVDSLVVKGQGVKAGFPLKARKTNFRINTLENRMIFDGQLLIDQAELAIDGTLMPIGNGNLIDITLQNDKGNVDHYLSLFPALKVLNLKQVNPHARMSLKIHNTGFVNPVTYPAMKMDFEISNAVIKSMITEDSLTDVHLIGSYTNGKKRDLSTTELIIKRGTAKLKENYLDIQGTVTNFIDPYVDISVQSVVELDEIKPFLNVGADRRLSGRVEVNALFKGNLEELEVARHKPEERFEGAVRFTNVHVDFKESDESLEAVNGLVEVKNRALHCDQITGQYNNASFKISGGIDNIVPLLRKVSTTPVHANIGIDIAHYRYTATENQKGKQSAKDRNLPKNLILNLALNCGQLHYEKYDIKDIQLAVRMRHNDLQMKSLLVNVDGASIAASGRGNIKKMTGTVDISAKIGEMNLDKYMADYQAQSAEPAEGLPAVDINLDLDAKHLIYHQRSFKTVNLQAHLTPDVTDLKNLSFTFPYGKLTASGAFSKKDAVEQILGKATLDLDTVEINELKRFYLQIIPPDTAQSEEKKRDVNMNFAVDVRSPRVYYDSTYINHLDSRFELDNNFITIPKIKFDFFKGDFFISGFVDDRSEDQIGAMVDVKADGILIGSMIGHLSPSQRELFSKHTFKGYMDVEGELLITYDKNNLEYQEDDLLSKVKLVLYQAELVNFTPITESLKFIKKDVREHIQLDNQNFEILFHNDEIIIPQTRFSSNLSNIEFIGYKSKDTDFSFDLVLSAGDLLFGSQKKKREKVKNQDTSLGAFNTYLRAQTEDEEMKINVIKKRDYEERLEKLKSRYVNVDEIMSQTKVSVIKNAQK